MNKISDKRALRKNRQKQRDTLEHLGPRCVTGLCALIRFSRPLELPFEWLNPGFLFSEAGQNHQLWQMENFCCVGLAFPGPEIKHTESRVCLGTG